MSKKMKYQTLDELIDEQFEEDPEMVPMFLEAVLEDYDHEQDEKALFVALRHMAKINGGMSDLARKTNLNRGKLYKTLSPEGNPSLKNFQRILHAFGYTVSIKPLSPEAKRKGAQTELEPVR